MSSLFGGPLNTGTSQAGGSSLFGASTTTSRPAQSTLFGTATTQSQPTSTLFGALGASQAQQQPAAQATTGASNTLFGRIGTSTAQPQQSTSGASLFGSLGASTAQPQQQAAGGLFGASTAAAATNTLAPAASTMQAPQSQGPLAQSTAASTSQSAYFDNLLERGKKRNKRENGTAQFGELPSLQLGLGDIARKVQKLSQGGPPPAQQARDSRVHYLLAASGVSTGATLRDWQSFASQAGLSTTGAPGAVDTDLEGYIANLQSQSTLAMISEGLEQSKRDFDTFLENNVQMEWDAQRRRIYEHLGLAKPAEALNVSQGDTASPAGRGAFGRSSRRGPMGASTRGGMSFKGSTMPRSVIGTPGAKGFGRSTAAMESPEKAILSPTPENRFTRDKQEKFAGKVRQLNLARLRDEVYPLLKEFAEVEQSSGTDTTPQLVDAYRALIEITGENTNAHRPTDPGAIRERQYTEEYLDPNPTSVPAVAIRTRILNGSRRFLEKKFFEEVETAIEKNPREANLGGIPTTINKVRAYIRLRAARKELGPENIELQKIGEDYCWVLIFYLIRCGLFQEAVTYVEENDRAIKSIDRNFHQYLRSYAVNPNRRISRELQNMVQTEYQRRIRLSPENSIDPYRLACLKVLGRCELNKRNLDGLNQGVDDWVWLQFSLAREINRAEDAAAESFGLDELRMTISEIGQKHFSDREKEGPAGSGVFFLLQMLGGMFEEAVFYLAQTNHVSAAHFAIALDFYGLLRVSDFATSGPDILSFTTMQKAQINFARMMGLYTMDFRQAKAEAACDYLTLICLNADLPGQAGQNHAEVCHEALRELVLETREFVQLIGDVRNDGKRIQGAIPQRMKLIKLATQDNFLKRVTQGAALIADNSGRTIDAVLLYFLADDHSKVIDVTIRCVSDALAVELGQPTKLEPLKAKPDDTNGAANVDDPSGSTLSSMSVDDPLALCSVISKIYVSALSAKLRSNDQRQLQTLELLYTMMLVRRSLEAGNWSRAIDYARNTELLPLQANGDAAVIRKCSSNFATLDHAITRNIGNFIMWSIMACGQQRRVLLSSSFDDPTRKAMAAEFMAMARDLMVYAGLIRYKLPPRVYEALAEAGQDVAA